MARTRTSGIRRLNRVKGTVYEVRFRDGEGRQRSRTFETKDEARAFQSAILADLREGTYVARSADAVPFKIGRAVVRRAVAGEAPDQITYRSAIDHNLAPLHDKPVGRIAFADVQAIVNEMIAAGRRPSTVRNVLMVARLILDDAVRRKLIRTNPCRDVKPPRLRPKDNVFLTGRAGPGARRRASAAAGPAGADGGRLRAAGGRAARPARPRRRAATPPHQRPSDRDRPRLRADRGHTQEQRRPPHGAHLAGAVRPAGGAIGNVRLGMDDLVFGDDGKPRRHNTFYQ